MISINKICRIFNVYLLCIFVILSQKNLNVFIKQVFICLLYLKDVLSTIFYVYVLCAFFNLIKQRLFIHMDFCLTPKNKTRL